MSHITAVHDVDVNGQAIGIPERNLSALEEACKLCGLEFVRGQNTYRCYYTERGEQFDALPEGMTIADLGKCTHAIRRPGFPKAYEIGLVPLHKEKPQDGFRLAWDSWDAGTDTGTPILDVAGGPKLSKLMVEYKQAVVANYARRLGANMLVTQSANGKRKVEIFV